MYYFTCLLVILPVDSRERMTVRWNSHVVQFEDKGGLTPTCVTLQTNGCGRAAILHINQHLVPQLCENKAVARVSYIW